MLSVQLFEAVLLVELLALPRARAVLLARSRAPGDADQRRLDPPDVLVTRMSQRESALGPDLGVARRRAERVLHQAQAAGCRAVVFGHPEYPARLAHIADPPPLLWLRGQPSRLAAPAVAIVGSRGGSPYALAVAERLGTDLSDRGVTVISGLARGVDGAAHRGSLVGAGGTVAVLGCGVDVIYPREHAALAAQIASTGAIVSELAPSVPPCRFHFPRRNRIISGLSLAVVVIEAARRSGSLITARSAADQGREVMAVPGNVLTSRNRGGHALIKDGAKLVETADDILDELDEIRRLEPLPGTARSRVEETGTSPDPLLCAMELGESYDLDTLVRNSGLERPAVAVRVVELELEGRIQRSEMGRFSRLRD